MTSAATVGRWTATMLGLAVLLAPQGAPAQLTKDEQRCIDQYNNNLRKVSQTAGKDYRKCVKDAGKGKVADPDTCVEEDTPGKIDDKEAKVTALYTSGKCTGAEPIQQGAVIGNDAHVNGVQDLTHDLFGEPITTDIVSPGGDAAKCVDKAMLRSVQGFTEIIKRKRLCAKDAMKTGAVVDSAELQCPCNGMNRHSFLLIKTKFDVWTAPACTAVTGALPDLFPGLDANCHTSTYALQLCLKRAVMCRACETLNAANGLSVNCDIADDEQPNASCGGDVKRPSAVLAGSKETPGSLAAPCAQTTGSATTRRPKPMRRRAMPTAWRFKTP